MMNVSMLSFHEPLPARRAARKYLRDDYECGLVSQLFSGGSGRVYGNEHPYVRRDGENDEKSSEKLHGHTCFCVIYI